MKPFNNKSRYDPGRMRYGIKFYQQITSDDGYGGTTVLNDLVLETKCAELQIGSYDQLAINVGASIQSKDRYFIIRKRPDWEPQKDMVLAVKGQKYTIRAIIDLDQPQHYWKILGAWQGTFEPEATQFTINAMPPEANPNIIVQWPE